MKKHLCGWVEIGEGEAANRIMLGQERTEKYINKPRPMETSGEEGRLCLRKGRPRTEVFVFLIIGVNGCTELLSTSGVGETSLTESFPFQLGT